MAYDDFKEGCSVIKEYADNLNKETAGKIPTKVSELTNDSNYATESYVNTAIGNIAQPSSLPQTYKKKAVTLATSGWVATGAEYNYAYTDADVKVNSEVRFTLDEANGKLAGQFGLKKTIDKEAGKLTFTADTLPTSAITGTLEIGETSTEGAAFVDGIATSVNGGEASSGGTVTSVSVKMNGEDKGTVTTSGTIDLGTVLTSWDDVGSEAIISIIGKALYPVGAIYMSTANVNPSTFIAGTTWVAWGSGRVPVGIDISDTDFNGVEKTGGEKTHTLTENEMPAHKHTGTEQESQKFNIEQGSTFETKRYTASFTSEKMQTASNSVANPNGSLSGSGEVVVEHGITAGGGQPHSILQPYITCYMWKRTA